MMFAQPLIKMWRPHWKFAFTVGLSIGAKFTTEGFFVADIIQHVTNEFTLDCLKEGEGIAIEMFDWANINQRCRNFRNALVNVALEEPLPAFEMPPPPMPNVIGQPDVANLHVLIVDDSEIICSVHEALVLQIRPDARTHMCHTCAAAAAANTTLSRSRHPQASRQVTGEREAASSGAVRRPWRMVSVAEVGLGRLR